MPAPVFLRPSTDRDDAEIDDLNLSKMDDDPFRYFLTPTPSAYTDDEDIDFDMDFDAGIEDTRRHHHASRLFRSISPSSLAGLGRRPSSPPQPLTPPRSPETPELDYDLSGTPDDHEQYEYMYNTSYNQDNSHDPWSRRLKNKFKSSSSSSNHNSDNLLSPPSLPDSFLLSRPSASTSVSRSGRGRGRPPSRSSSSGGNWRRSRGTPGRISPHAWREPSPDVWAIEEEPEAEDEEMQEDVGEASAGPVRALDIPAAKPRKRVRFVLPALEDVRGGYY